MRPTIIFAALVAVGISVCSRQVSAAEERVDCTELDFKVTGSSQAVECTIDQSEHDVEYQNMTALQDDNYAVIVYIKTGHNTVFKAYSVEEVAKSLGFGAAAGEKGGYEDYSYGLFNRKNSSSEACYVFKRESMMMPQVHQAKRLTIGFVCPTTGDVGDEAVVKFLKSLDVPI